MFDGKIDKVSGELARILGMPVNREVYEVVY